MKMKEGSFILLWIATGRLKVLMNRSLAGIANKDLGYLNLCLVQGKDEKGDGFSIWNWWCAADRWYRESRTLKNLLCFCPFCDQEN